jgi:hypothetical protein
MAEAPPSETTKGLLFTLKEISISSTTPTMNEPFTVKGKVALFGVPFLGPIWVIATATYPETWWEEIIPLIGSPEVRASDIALGGNFEITFDKGFQREGEFGLSVRLYAGPTVPIDSIVLPPAPAAATFETTFVVAGEAPQQDELFNDFSIVSYSKNGGTSVTPSDVLELDVGDRCRVNVSFSHQGPAVSGKFHAAIWHKGLLDPHDEILAKEQSFSVPQSTDWKAYEASIDIIITSAISPGSDYGLYCKIIGISGSDLFTQFLEDVITITGVGEGQVSKLEITDYDTPVAVGDKCNIKVRFTYQGPEISRNLYAAIGNYGTFGFDEVVKGSKTINIPESPVPTEYEGTVAISITSAINPTGSPYDIYAKIDGVQSEILQSVITIAGAAAQGSIITKYINKSPEGSRLPLPTTVKADKNTFEVGVTAKNVSAAAFVGAIEVKVYDPNGMYRPSNPATDWAGISPGETLRWEYNISQVDKVGVWTIDIKFLEQSTGTVLDEVQTTMTVTDGTGGDGGTGKQPPEIDVLSAKNITDKSVTLSAKLVDEGFCSGAYCYIEWGKTTSYGQKSNVVRLQPGETVKYDIEGLDPDTKYYFRAIAEGRCETPNLVGYSQGRYFYTEEEEVKGFSLRVIGAPSEGKYWNCDIEWQTGESVELWPPIPIGSTWHYDGEVPNSRVDICVNAYAKSTGGAYVKHDCWQYIFRLYAGQSYVCDFANHRFTEEQ